MRKRFFGGNWKMNMTKASALAYAEDFTKLADTGNTDIAIFPPSTLLDSLSLAFEGTGIILGSQDVFFEEKGAYTGELSCDMITDFCNTTIIGHSERRKYFHESIEITNKKIKKAISKDMSLVFCIGETLEEREQGKAKDIIKSQLLGGLENINEADMKSIIIAYEPVWAIGTGKTATPKEAEEMHAYIRSLLKERFDNLAAESTRIIYGGSVKPNNVEELIACPNIDGGLVGGASLDPNTFAELIEKGSR